jgi:hypothetical protein
MGVVLMLVITLILAALVLLMMVQLPSMYDQSVPAIFKITKIRHVNEQGNWNLDSYMVVMNTGTSGYKNKNLYAKTYRNGVELNCRIPTLNGEAFIDGSRHYDVQYLRSRGLIWYPASSIGIDYKDGTFHPGDSVTFEVYDNSTKQIISRDTYTA